MKIYNNPFINQYQNRFYPRYGATPNRKSTNIYKNGKTKGANKIQTRTIRIKKDLVILISSKKH